MAHSFFYRAVWPNKCIKTVDINLRRMFVALLCWDLGYDFVNYRDDPPGLLLELLYASPGPKGLVQGLGDIMELCLIMGTHRDLVQYSIEKYLDMPGRIREVDSHLHVHFL